MPDLQETRHRPSLAELQLQREPMAGGWLGRPGGERAPACGLRQNLDGAMARQGAIQRGACVPPRVVDRLEKVRGVGGQRERGLIRRAVHRKGRGATRSRVPIALRPAHPHVLAAKLVAQGWQDTQRVGEAVAPLAPLGIGCEHGRAPVLPAAPRPRAVRRDGRGAPAPGESALAARERPEEPLRGGVVRATFPGLEERGQPPARVRAIGAAHARLDGRTREGARRLPLFDEITERGLTDDRQAPLVAHAGRVSEAGRRQAIEPAGLPMPALAGGDEDVFDLPCRLGAQAVAQCQQPSHPEIRACSPAEQTADREEGQPERHGLPAALRGCFDRHPLAIRVEPARGQGVAQGRREGPGPAACQLGELLPEGVQRRAPRGRPECLEPGPVDGRGRGVSVRDRRLRRPS